MGTNTVIPVPSLPRHVLREVDDWQLPGGIHPLRYGRLRVAVRVAGRHRLELHLTLASMAGRPHAFRLTPSGPRRLPSAAAPCMLTLPSGREVTCRFAIVMEIGEDQAPATLPPIWTAGVTGAITLVDEASGPIARAEISFTVAPLVLPSSLDQVNQVLVVDAPATAGFIQQLEPVVQRAGATVLRVPSPAAGDRQELDVWIRDAGLFACVRPAPPTTDEHGIALIRGIRARVDDLSPEALDAAVVTLARELQALIVRPAEPDDQSGWIDWYGNIVVSPPLHAAGGAQYPHGRVITGSKGSRTISAGLLTFLDSQGLQTPPLVLDTSWLLDGHVDEVVTFVPCRRSGHFKALVPSVRLAARILMDLAIQGEGGLPIFAGFPEETTVSDLLHTVAESDETRWIGRAIDEIRGVLKSALSMTDAQFVECPVLFRHGSAVIPNAVNCLVCNDHVVLPRLFGPVTAHGDAFQEPVETALRRCGLEAHWLDEWNVLHRMQGEVHCGTNSISRLRARPHC